MEESTGKISVFIPPKNLRSHHPCLKPFLQISTCVTDITDVLWRKVISSLPELYSIDLPCKLQVAICCKFARIHNINPQTYLSKIHFNTPPAAHNLPTLISSSVVLKFTLRDLRKHLADPFFKNLHLFLSLIFDRSCGI